MLLLVAIAVSIGGTLISISRLGQLGITGRLADNTTGQVNFTIQNQFSIRFINNAIPFGTGYVNSSSGCQMGTNGSSAPTNDPDGCNGFNATVNTLNLTIENDGNIRANISLNFTANASGFIGGTSPSFQFEVTQGEASSCTTIGNGSAFREVGNLVGSSNSNDTNLTGSRICTNLDYQDATDLLEVGAYISIPQNAASGDHRVTITAIGCDDGTC